MSGLAVNVSKTTLFSSGIEEAEIQRIATRFGLARSNLPVRYLGTPLCTKKLSFSDCDPLLLQIKKKMSSWTTRALSMAGRLTMLTSVISGIIGRLLKLRSKAIEFIRISIGNGEATYFWWDPWTPFGSLYSYLGQDGPTRLGVPLFALVSDVWNGNSWSLPEARSNCQLDLLAFLTTISPTDIPDSPSWIVNGQSQNLFISRLVGEAIRPNIAAKSWAPLIWHKGIIPRHATTTWLFILDRNPTLDRLHSWGLDVETTCLLCGLDNESRNHLFFECHFSSQVWSFICARLNIFTPPHSWNAVLLWLPSASPERALKIALLQAWQATVYCLWQERNARFHSGLTIPAAVLGRNIHRIVSDKANALVSLGHSLGPPLLRIWKPP
ncbi:uncharacterized protein LOC108858819 [Raphanus sativus]|uniref:Uncharacterized protein LOC108858819 n=1 Tax=Raphanus sativus TaxID=3726 RepID=A0A6J0NU29_RAPSA|nr:uncharacterized protein LOC108858819 [Raphanus sativus]